MPFVYTVLAQKLVLMLARSVDGKLSLLFSTCYGQLVYEHLFRW